MSFIIFQKKKSSILPFLGITTFKFSPNSPEWNAKFLEILETPETEEDVKVLPLEKNQVNFYLFNNKNSKEPLNISDANIDIIDEGTDKLFVLVHGWLESREQKWYEDLKNSLLDKHPKSSVIEVDYSDPAFDIYQHSVAWAENVGELVADFLINIIEKRKIPSSNIIFLAHSLGSHVSGFASKKINNILPKVGRIIAMDPAGPKFDDKQCDKRLCKSDAEVVLALHTDAGNYGYSSSIGTIDFYANGGYKQNGCPETADDNPVNVACEHCRSWAYVIEAIKNPKHFVSKKCKDWKTYEENQEKCEKTSVTLGDLESKEEGIFYFATHEKEPFAMEDDGLTPSAGCTWKNDIVLAIILMLSIFWTRKVFFCVI